MTDGERGIAMDPDPPKSIEDGARRFDLGLEDVEPGRTVLA